MHNKADIKTILSIISLVIVVLGIAIWCGQQRQRLDNTIATQLRTKDAVKQNSSKISELDKVSTANKDNLSSLQTWTSSNILDLEHVLKDQKDRLTRTNTRQEHNKEYLINYTDKQCKPS